MVRIFFFILVLAVPVRAVEYGIMAEQSQVDRERLARTIYTYDFENVRDPDTGLLLPESDDYDGNGWPDFWEPVRAVGFPEYLINTISIEADKSGQLPGRYRDDDNHVLRIGFDGTRVGVRTSIPVPIDPGLFYEFSLRTRDTGLKGARIRAGVEWMRIDPAAVLVVRSDEVPDLAIGQVDWPVGATRMLVTDIPSTANAARFFVIIERDPESIGGAYHGQVWIDDIRLRPHPKIIIDAPVLAADGGQVIPVRYSGLFDNVPDPANPGFFRGKRYFRRVEVTDIFNRPVGAGLRNRQQVSADDDGLATEEMIFPREKFGVYYFNIRLYDADDRLSTDVMRAVAVMRPPAVRDQMQLSSGKPTFGVNAGVVPDSILSMPGGLRRIIERTGTRQTKLIPWSLDYLGAGERYYASLAAEIRSLRSAGIGVTGVLRPPASLFGTDRLGPVLSEDSKRFTRLIDEVGRRLGLFMDGWQWGDDRDGTLAGTPSSPAFDEWLSTLYEYSGGLPIIESLHLRPDLDSTRFPVRPNIVQAFHPASESAQAIWPYAASVFPWLFEPYYRERGRIYPPARLASLSPVPATDRLEQQERDTRRTGSWISLESLPAYPHEPNAAAEKIQLEQLLRSAVYSTVVAPDLVFLGELFDPARGLLRRDALGDNMLETMARPSYLAVNTITHMLEGAEYLGQLGLLAPYEAHVFRRSGTDEAVIAIWHNDPVEERQLARSEIANGPPLQLVDWAGNSEPLGRSIPVSRVPAFITGMPAALALTRMSVRVAPEPPIMAENRTQAQMLEIVNHLPSQAPILFRLHYAARQEDGGMENGWTISPEELRINLPPVTPELTPGFSRFIASPDPNSQLQSASPNQVNKLGGKLAQVVMAVNSAPPADMTLYLPFQLQSNLDVDIEHLRRIDDPHFVTLQLKVRWFPPDAGRRRGEILLLPFYMKRGQTREAAAFPIPVKASPVEDRGNPNAMFEAVELRIPRTPQTQTWVGLSEDGGSSFYLADVTDFLLAP